MANPQSKPNTRVDCESNKKESVFSIQKTGVRSRDEETKRDVFLINSPTFLLSFCLLTSNFRLPVILIFYSLLFLVTSSGVFALPSAPAERSVKLSGVPS